MAPFPASRTEDRPAQPAPPLTQEILIPRAGSAPPLQYKYFTFILLESPRAAQESLLFEGMADAKARLQRKNQGHGQGCSRWNSREAHAPTGNFTFYSFQSSTSHNGNPASRGNKRFPKHFFIPSSGIVTNLRKLVFLPNKHLNQKPFLS